MNNNQDSQVNAELVINNLATANAMLQKENAILQAQISELQHAIAQQQNKRESSNEI